MFGFVYRKQVKKVLFFSTIGEKMSYGLENWIVVELWAFLSDFLEYVEPQK